MRLRILGAALALTLVGAVVPSCASPESLGGGLDTLGNGGDFGPSSADAGLDASPVEHITYCPSNNCPPGHTTCSDSNFPCEVDLRTDRNNCGECGAACPPEDGVAVFECIEGRCVLTCSSLVLQDCDGIPDNKCETLTWSDDNCGACGNKCLDPVNKPCLVVDGHLQCGCPPDLTYCPGADPPCVDLSTSDDHCGACNQPCDPTGGGRALTPRTRWSCGGGTCIERVTSPDDPAKGDICAPIPPGPVRKCTPNDGDVDPFWGDCNLDPPCNADGCETHLFDDENCGACGNKCEPGQTCRLTTSGQPFCACADEGTTYCVTFAFGPIIRGQCFDLTTNAEHCGSCDNSCDERRPNARPGCRFGTCIHTCIAGYADCNGNAQDGCEIYTMSDPTNCGGCGIKCEGVSGQACVGGRCVVEPCDLPDDAGVPTR